MKLENKPRFRRIPAVEPGFLSKLNISPIERSRMAAISRHNVIMLAAGGETPPLRVQSNALGSKTFGNHRRGRVSRPAHEV